MVAALGYLSPGTRRRGFELLSPWCGFSSTMRQWVVEQKLEMLGARGYLSQSFACTSFFSEIQYLAQRSWSWPPHQVGYPAPVPSA
jgi:hypothetical protein